MKHYLALVEKPSACREFQKVYNSHRSAIEAKIGGDIDFFPLAGHLVRNAEPKELQWDKKWQVLYEEDLPMIPREWVLKPIDRNKNILNDLKKKIKDGGYDAYIAMTDSDQEGNLIYHLVATYLGIDKCETLRFYETALTEKDILASFLSMKDFYKTPQHFNTTQAGIFRSRWDWLIGMNLTTAYTVRYGELIRYGSVKAPTLKLIYDNDYAIANFKQITTYGIKSKHAEGFESTLLNEDDNKDRSFQTKDEADKFAATLDMKATVKSFTKKLHTTKAPKLYSLSDLQVDAAKFGLSPAATLDVAQSLYETHKILSYPRTSGTHLSSGKSSDFPDLLNSIKDIPEIKSFVLKITSDDIARASADPNIVNDKEVAKASHDALIPTGKKVDWDALNDREKQVFLLVCKRFVAHFMPLFTEEKCTMILDNNGNPFKADGRKTIENGFNDIFEKTSKDVLIPEHKAGDVIDIEANVVYEKISKPPARYTMGTIINAMKNIGSNVADPKMKAALKETSGLGTEATRANILKELQESNYISVSKNAIYITDAGKRYVENIRQLKEDNTYDFGMGDPMQVAYWSAQNKQIQLGEKTVDEVMDSFIKYLNKKIADLKASGDPIKMSRAEAAAQGLPPCPLCGGKVAAGKFGYYCSTYKESGCKLSIPNEMASKTLTDNQKKGLLEGKKVHAKGFKSKAGKDFEADIVLNKETGKVEFDFSAPKKPYPNKK